MPFGAGPINLIIGFSFNRRVAEDDERIVLTAVTTDPRKVRTGRGDGEIIDSLTVPGVRAAAMGTLCWVENALRFCSNFPDHRF